MAKIIIKNLKVVGIAMIVFLVMLVAIIIIFSINFTDKKIDKEISGGDAWIINHINVEDYEDANKVEVILKTILMTTMVFAR